MKSQQFPNQGYVQDRISEHTAQILWRVIHSFDDQQPQVDHSHVGTVQSELRITDGSALSAIFHCVQSMVDLYVREHHHTVENRPLQLGDVWCNQQRRGEYMVPHTHRSVFSFALWLQVPYTIDQELALKGDKTGRETASFQFHYTDTLGRITPYVLAVDQTWENTIILFPGDMTHSVTPFFSSDGVRVSVSGNIVYGE